MRYLPVIGSVTHAEQVAGSQPAQAERPWRHLLAGERPLVFVVEGSQLFEVSPDFFEALEAGNDRAELSLRSILSSTPRPAVNFESIGAVAAVSLNIAQTCNLSCTYCYADEGLFGGRPKLMTEAVACKIIDQLIDKADCRAVTIGFIGGEPLLNRRVLYRSVEYAREKSRQSKVAVRFSITTNGTLIEPDDIALLRDNAFAVSVSIDGAGVVHDKHRRARNGRGSYEEAIKRLRPLLQNPGRTKLAARATITRDDLRIAERIEALADEGFKEIGVSPLRTSPDPGLILLEHDWQTLLDEMRRAAEIELCRLSRGESLRFSNLAVALKEIHRGACRPLPCGAAANYVSVNVEGQCFTCHRVIDDPGFALGSLETGLLPGARESFLRTRHVDSQAPCASCWARYLCGGGCHAEVIANGRSGCDYIRGWLEYCLRAYNRIALEHPDFFNSAEGIAA